MSEMQGITSADVAVVSADEPTEVAPNTVGKTPVTVSHPVTAEQATIHVPDDNIDRTVRFEFPDGTKGEWVNPNGVEVINEPGPGDDVMWDASVHAYVPRVKVTAGESGASAETASA